MEEEFQGNFARQLYWFFLPLLRPPSLNRAAFCRASSDKVFLLPGISTVAEFILAGKVFGETFRMKEKVGG